MFKKRYKNEADIPAEHKKFYAEKNGEWVLELEDDDSGTKIADLTKKVNEFRDNNLALQKKLTELDGKAVLSKEEYEELKKLKEMEDKNKDKKLIEEGKFEELLSQRTQKMREDYEGKIGALTKARDENATKYTSAQNRLSTIAVDQEVSKAFGEIAVPRPGALADIASRARSVWRLNEEGKVIALDDEGKPVYGTKGEPLTLGEWAAELVKSAPHLFEESKGGNNKGTQKQSNNNNSNQVSRISRTDEDAKSRSIEDLAKGKVQLVD